MGLEKRIILTCLTIGLGGILSGDPGSEKDSFSWERMDELVQLIQAPTFPDRDFPVTDFGAVPDGQTDCTDAFRRAITACAAAGGGRVVARGGVFRTGPIHLLSNVNLHISEGATLSFYTDPERFLPAVLTRYEGVEVLNYSPLIYARDQRNIAVTGEGTLDGNAGPDNWWAMTPPRSKDEDPDNPHTRTRLFEMAEAGVPVVERNFGSASQLRPTFIQFYSCEQVLVEGITLLNAPFWMIHPVLSRHVTVRGVTCESSGPNNDGCDPESSEFVLIEDCTFNTKDDGVAIKAGRNADGRRVNRPSRNIVIRNCIMNTQHTAVAIGSEMTGGVEHVYAENLTCSEIQRVFRIKTNSMRGGFVRHIGMRNATVEKATGTLIDFRTDYGREVGPYYPEVQDVDLRNILCAEAEQAISFNGTEKMPIQRLRLESIRVEESRKASWFSHVLEMTTENVDLGSDTSADQGPMNFRVNAAKAVGPNTRFWQAAGHDYLFHLVNTPTGQAFMDRAETNRSLRYFRTHFTFNTTTSDDIPGLAVGGGVAEIQPDGTVHYDFSKVNQTFREYVKRGMKPIVEFGFFPDGFARDFEAARGPNRGGYHEREAVPVDWERWEELQRAFMENLEEEFGKEELRTWYFEVWNEPDSWPLEHIDVFFRMYDVFAHVVKSHDANYRVGGPGSFTEIFLDRFLRHVQNGTNHVTGETGSPIDFVSHHLYGISGKWVNQTPQLLPQVAFFQRELRWLNRIIQEYPKAEAAEFHLNEWGLSSRFRRTVDRFPELEYRNNHVSALFLVKLVDELFALADHGSLRTDLLLYWGFTWEAERGWMFRGNRELWTGGGVAKPILHGFELLGRLLDERLEVVEGPRPGGRFGILPTRSGSHLAMVVYNFEETDKALDTRDPVRVQLSGLEGYSGIHWELTALNKDQNNSFTRWQEAGRPPATDITPDMAAELNRLQVDARGTTAIHDGELTLELALASHSMVLIEATLQP